MSEELGLKRVGAFEASTYDQLKPIQGIQDQSQDHSSGRDIVPSVSCAFYNVEDLMNERRIDVSQEAVRYWWTRFGPMFASEILRKRVQQQRAYSKWKWHVDEVFFKINGQPDNLWRQSEIWVLQKTSKLADA